MTKTYYWGLVVAAAFVAGTMTTGGVVYASFDQCNNDPPMGISDGKPFLEVWAAICDLESQISDINVDDADNDPTNELQQLSGDRSVDLSDGGGSVPCEDITGGEGLCDGSDDVGPVLGFYQVETERTFEGDNTGFIFPVAATCDEGDKAVSSGFAHALNPDLMVVASLVDRDNAEKVNVNVYEPNDGDSILVQATCADFAPAHIP